LDVFHGNWLRLLPWSSPASFVTTNNFTYTISSGIGTLHDGYFGAPRAYGGPYTISNGTLQTSASYKSLTPDALHCSLYRQAVYANGYCKATFQLHEYSGPAVSSNSVLYACIIGRWSGSTIYDNAATAATLGGANLDEASVDGTERHEGGSGYVFLFAQNLTTPGQRHLLLIRVNNGVATLLAEQRVPTALTTYWANARDLKMTITGQTKTVTIVVQSEALSKLIPANGSGAQSISTFTYNDSDPDRIVSAGRWGMGTISERDPTGSGYITCLIHQVELFNSNPVRVEDWDRGGDVAKSAAYKVAPGGSGVTGRNLHCRYYGDAFSASNALSMNRYWTLSNSKLAPRVNQISYPCIDLLPNSQTSCRRTMTCTLTLPSSNQTAFASIAHRVKFLPGYTVDANSFPRMYANAMYARVSVSNFGSAFFAVSTFLTDSSGEIVSTSTSNDTWFSPAVKYNLSLGVEFSFDFEVFNAPSGNAAFRILINGNPVTFASPGSVTPQGNGYYEYASTTADQESGAHGALGATQTSSRVDDWTLAAASGSGLEARTAHQIVFLAANQATQARTAQQIVFLATNQETQSRTAQQIVMLAHRTSPGTFMAGLAAAFAFQAGAATISNVLSVSAEAANFFFVAGAASPKIEAFVIPLYADPAGQLVLSGLDAGTINSSGAAAAQL